MKPTLIASSNPKTVEQIRQNRQKETKRPLPKPSIKEVMQGYEDDQERKALINGSPIQ